jgi:mRNA-degrading endonuclease RelE of RelBE toxin-antitoxin system
MKSNFIVVNTPAFVYQIEKLSKKYPNVARDIKPCILSLYEKGSIDGEECIPGIKMAGYKFYKARIINSAIHKGKSNGFRLIHYAVSDKNAVYVLAIYSKNDKQDMPPQEIREAVEKYEKYLENCVDEEECTL